MGLDLSPGQNLAPAEPPPAWGELVPPGQIALVLRVVLDDGTVSFPTGELRRWEHTQGTPERLMIHAGREEITIEGSKLAPLRAALDLGRLGEVRQTFSQRTARSGPQVRRITIETP